MFVFLRDIHAVTKHQKHCQKVQTRYNSPKRTQTNLQPGTTVPKAQKTNYQKNTNTHCLKIVRVCNLLVAIISVTGKVTPQLLVMIPRS